MSYAVYYFEKNNEIRIQSRTFYPDGDFCVSIFKREDGKGYSFNKWETYGISSSKEREELGTQYFSTGQELFSLIDALGIGHVHRGEEFKILSPELERQYQEALRQAVLTPAERPDPFQEKQLRLLREKESLWQEPLTGMEFVWVPGGRFEMGIMFNTKENYNQVPNHVVILGDFWMGRYPVTNQEYRQFAPDHFSGEGFDDPRQPVVNVNWEDAQDYVHWLSEKTGCNFSLPTEAQWEYAAQNAGKGEYYGASTTWHRDNSGGRTHAVGSTDANDLGLHDMWGNVEEWCLDWLDEEFYKKYRDKQSRNPVCSDDTSGIRVLRGGSWSKTYKEVSSFYRGGNWPEEHNTQTGFRLVCLPGARKKNQYLKKPVRQNEKSGSKTRPPKRSGPSRIISKPEKGKIWTERLTKMDFVWLSEGRFMMGSPAVDRKALLHETPQHEVELDGFWMGRYPVTIALKKKFLVLSQITRAYSLSKKSKIANWKSKIL